MDKAQVAEQFVEEWRNVEFERGKTDCCMFVADYVQRLTGEDRAKEWRGKYHDAKGAERILRKAGGMAALLSSKLGPMQPPLTVCRGDVVYGGYEEGDACGICVGHSCAFMAAHGIALKPLASIKGCWHV